MENNCKHQFVIVGVDNGRSISCCIHCGFMKRALIFWINKRAFSPYRLEVDNT